MVCPHWGRGTTAPPHLSPAPTPWFTRAVAVSTCFALEMRGGRRLIFKENEKKVLGKCVTHCSISPCHPCCATFGATVAVAPARGCPKAQRRSAWGLRTPPTPLQGHRKKAHAHLVDVFHPPPSVVNRAALLASAPRSTKQGGGEGIASAQTPRVACYVWPRNAPCFAVPPPASSSSSHSLCRREESRCHSVSSLQRGRVRARQGGSCAVV